MENQSFHHFISAAKENSLLRLINTISRDQWTDQPIYGQYTLLYFACIRDNRDALVALLLHGLDINWELDNYNFSLIVKCIDSKNEMSLKIVCAAGHKMDRTNGWNPLEYLFEGGICHDDKKYAFILIANGCRLENVKNEKVIDQEFYTFQRGVIKCRDAIVVLLGLKKRRQVLHKLDRFLIQQELAVAIWSTRSKYNEK